MIEIYELVKVYGRKSGKCLCGISRTRTTTFTQTINSYNRINGRPKTRPEIVAELAVEREIWMIGQITCDNCRK